MVQRRRLAPKERREQIIAAFLWVARTKGYQVVTRSDVAKRLDISEALVTRYFSDSMDDLRADALTYAIEHRNDKIIAQALTVNDPLVSELSEEIIKEVKQSLFA